MVLDFTLDQVLDDFRVHYVVWDGEQYLDPAPEGKLRYPSDGPEIAGERTVCWASAIVWSEERS